MKIICIEGVHGSGKSSLIKLLHSSGFNVLDEGFINMPTYCLPPQSFVMESMWVMQWIERCLRLKKEGAPSDAVYFADRSPFSASFYASPNGHLLEPHIKEQLRELKELADIEIICVHVKVEENLLWKRIQERLKQEPERKKYHEDSYDWMLKVMNFYEAKRHLWDYTIHNNEHMNKLLTALMAVVSEVNSRKDSIKDLKDAKEQRVDPVVTNDTIITKTNSFSTRIALV